MPNNVDLSSILQNMDARTFIQEGGSSPGNPVEYMGCTMLGQVTIPLGDRETIYCPSPDQYRKFVAVDRKVNRPGTPTTELSALMQRKGVDRQARMAREGCPFTLYQNFGKCTRPDSFDEFEKTLIMEGAEFTEVSYSELGVIDDDGEKITITTPVSFDDAYQVVPISLSERASAEVTVEVVDVAICDQVSCGDCDDPSGGCEDIYAITLGVGASPGNAPEIVYSTDKGATWNDDNITTYNGSEGADAIGCVGTLLVVASDLGLSHSWAQKSDPTTWTEVSTGYVAGKGPRALYVKSAREVFFAGRGGYIYKATDVTASVTAKDSGVETTQNLNAIHGFGNTIVAVGASNAVVVSKNGGEIWDSITGPVVGVELYTVWVKTPKEWWVGSAGGNLYYTKDEGATWAAAAFDGSGSGRVDNIKFVTPSVGYMTHATSTPVARLFRTKDGGATWRRTSSYLNNTPAADRFNAIAVCQDPNFVVVVGLGDNGTDGIIAIGS